MGSDGGAADASPGGEGWQRGQVGKSWADSRATTGKQHDIHPVPKALNHGFLTPKAHHCVGYCVGQPEDFTQYIQCILPSAWNKVVAQEV